MLTRPTFSGKSPNLLGYSGVEPRMRTHCDPLVVQGCDLCILLDLPGILLATAQAVSAEGGRMKRVAVFGNAGGGKSTHARELAQITSLPLHSLDRIKYKPGGGEVPPSEYLAVHTSLLRTERWIIDGFGCVASAWERFSAADTLIYVDLPLFTHYAWVTKRLIKGLVVTLEGWPENSPMWSSTLSSYRVLQLCHQRLTPRYRQLIAEEASRKRVHHLTSPRAMKTFLHAVRQEYSGS
jgi:adenylate kinase family enzyme